MAVVAREKISFIVQARDYAAAAASASVSRCPECFSRYAAVRDRATNMIAQKIPNSPFEGDAVRDLVDELRSIDGRCDDVAKYGVNAPARTVRGDEPSPVPTVEPPPQQPYVPKPPTTGKTTKTPTKPSTDVTPKPNGVAKAGLPWWAWALVAFGGVYLYKQGKKKRKTRRNPARGQRLSSLARTRRVAGHLYPSGARTKIGMWRSLSPWARAELLSKYGPEYKDVPYKAIKEYYFGGR